MLETAKHGPSLAGQSRPSDFQGQVIYAQVPTGDPDSLFAHPHLIVRPYYFKEKAYEHEREIRLVMAVNPDTSSVDEKGCITIDVNPKQLIQRVVISPQLFPSEAHALASIVKTKLPDVEVVVSNLLYEESGERYEVVRVLGEAFDKPFSRVDVEVSLEGDKEVEVPLPPELFSQV